MAVVVALALALEPRQDQHQQQQQQRQQQEALLMAEEALEGADIIQVIAPIETSRQS